MDGTIKLAATAVLVLIVVACGNSTGAGPTVNSNANDPAAGNTVTIAGDSEWQIPPDFNVVLPLTYQQIGAMLANDVGPPPDMPDFTMTREVTSGMQESVIIAVYSDGVSTEAGPREVLASWTESIAGAEYVAMVTVGRVGLEMATWRGQTQGPGQDSPQGIIPAVIYDLETHKVWRVMCIVSSEETSDEDARICDQVQADFRPL